MELERHVATEKESLRNDSHVTASESGSNTCVIEVLQVTTASEQKRALNTNMLMEKVTTSSNMNEAYKRVIQNKGAGGVDKMGVAQLKEWLTLNREGLIQSLRDGTYQPKPVRRVDIPKPAGGTRKLGIPTVIDRLVQQAMLQVLTPILDPLFSESSFGFRPGRSAHDALKEAQEYVQEGREIVVDIDLEKFFDNVNHDILMARLARQIEDKRFLKIVRKFLQSGIMQNGVCMATETGTPQGGPLSPILANLMLDDLDKELEKRNHKFCRYADDCNIYVYSMAAGERVMESIKQFLDKKLRLKINTEKSQVSPVLTRKFLGYTITPTGRLIIAEDSIKRFKEKIRKITGRRRGIEIERVIKELNMLIPGWIRYFKLAAAKTRLSVLDSWIKHKLRCYRWVQLKKPQAKGKLLLSLGVKTRNAWITAYSGKGVWRLSASISVSHAMNNQWFNKLGLISLEKTYLTL